MIKSLANIIEYDQLSSRKDKSNYSNLYQIHDENSLIEIRNIGATEFAFIIVPIDRNSIPSIKLAKPNRINRRCAPSSRYRALLIHVPLNYCATCAPERVVRTAVNQIVRQLLQNKIYNSSFSFRSIIVSF